MNENEWSIQEVARLAGTTSRALRHYGDVGLLTPSRVGASGHRYYDADALVRLQRVLLLRQLGLGIPAIAAALASDADDARALTEHLARLAQEKERLDRQIASVEHTIAALKRGEELMAEKAFDGFDHTAYREEVIERWGTDAYAKGDGWWRSLSKAEQQEFQAEHRRIAADYQRAQDAGEAPGGAVVQAVVARHVAWLERSSGPIGAERLRGLGELYVADPRFAANYGGVTGAAFVRDAFAARE